MLTDGKGEHEGKGDQVSWRVGAAEPRARGASIPGPFPVGEWRAQLKRGVGVDVP